VTIEYAAPAKKPENKAMPGSPTPATVTVTKPSAAIHSTLTHPAELHGRESEPDREEVHTHSKEARSVSEETSGREAEFTRKTELKRKEAEHGREFAIPEADSSSIEATPFPTPGSSAREILAWWGQRTLKNSRTFAAQREERTHRELLERLRQSLLSQSKALQTQAVQAKALHTQASVTNGDLSTASPTQNSLTPTGHTLAACLYLTVHCIKCESVRQGRPDYPPSSTVPCPRCGSESSFTVLGAGLTSKPLPFYEVQPTARFSEEGKPRIPWDPLGPLARNRLKDGEE